MRQSEYPILFDHTHNVEIKDYIATITLDCPQKENKVNEQFTHEFHKTMVDLRYNEDVRVIIIRANGPAFFGSGDGPNLIFNRMAFSEQLARQFMTQTLGAVREMKECGKVIIGCMDAPAKGGGCGYTLACDVLFGTKKAGFVPALHALCGLVPDCGGIYAFSRYCGPQKALWYAVRPEPVSAEEALKDGLIAKLFDDADSMYEEAYKLAAYIAAQPPYGMYGIKMLTSHVNDFSFETYAAFEAELVANGVHTKDFANVTAAIMEGDPSKRVFKGY